jgi:hypothetical protein
MKNVNTKLIICLIVLLLQNTFSFAQETIQQYKSRLTRQEHGQFNSNKPINFTSSEDGKYTLVFSDKAKDQIIKTIDIREQNPFSDIGLKTSGQYYDIISFQNRKFEEVFPNFNFASWVRYNRLYDTIEINQVTVSYGYGDSNNGQYAAVAYFLGNEVVGICRTLLVVFDSTGIELNRLTVDVGANQISITDDGKYLILSYGAYEEDQIVLNKGIIILNIYENSLVVNREIDNLSGVSTYKNFLKAATDISEREGKRVIKWYFFMIETSTIYSKELDIDCLGKAEITSYGVIMNCLNGSTYKLTFVNDFTMEDLR